MYQIASYCQLQNKDYVLLRCECGECIYLDMTNVKSHSPDRLTLKKEVIPLVCQKCNKPHNDSTVYLEPQGIRPGIIGTPPKTFWDYWAENAKKQCMYPPPDDD